MKGAVLSVGHDDNCLFEAPPRWDWLEFRFDPGNTTAWLVIARANPEGPSHLGVFDEPLGPITLHLVRRS